MSAERYMPEYIECVMSNTLGFLAINLSPKENAEQPVVQERFATDRDTIVDIPFFGKISGNFFLAVDRNDWHNFFKEMGGSDDELDDLFSSSMKELTNMIANEAITAINEDYPGLTLQAPRIIFGRYEGPLVKAHKIILQSDDVGILEAGITLDLMAQSMGNILDAESDRANQAIKELDVVVDMQDRMLNSIKQAIFVVGSNKEIEDGSSAYCQTLFGDLELKGINFFDLIFPVDERNTPFYSRTNTLFTVAYSLDDLQWALLDGDKIEEFEAELLTGSHILEIQYSPIYKFEVVEKIMVIIKDITELRISQETDSTRALMSGEHAKIMSELVPHTAQQMFDFITESAGQIEALNTVFKSVQTDDDNNQTATKIKDVCRFLHTIKGTAGLYKFEELKNVTHELEDLFLALYEDQKKSEAWVSLIDNIEVFNACYERYCSVGRQMFDIAEADQNKITSQDFVCELRKRLVDFRRLLQSRAIDFNEIEARLETMERLVVHAIKKPVARLFPYFEELPKNIAKEKEKHVYPLGFVDGNVRVDKTIFECLRESILHMIRNSVDHGIETAAIRRQRGKDNGGQLSIIFTEDDAIVEMLFIDDGGGIDTKKLVQKALETDLYTQEEMDQLTEEKRLELIFHSGLSSNDTVDDISGRGLGMDIVKNNIENLGGKIHVSSELTKGTTFQVIFQNEIVPHDNVIRLESILYRSSFQSSRIQITPYTGTGMIYSNFHTTSQTIELIIEHLMVVTFPESTIDITLKDKDNQLLVIFRFSIKEDSETNLSEFLNADYSGIGRHRSHAIRKNLDHINCQTEIHASSLTLTFQDGFSKLKLPGVLVVDDEPFISKVVTKNLRKFAAEIGYSEMHIETAQSGSEALEKLKQSGDQLPIVLSDYHMPGMNGLQLLQKINVQFPDHAFIMLTGERDLYRLMSVLKYGAVNYLQKPIDANELRLCFYNMIELHNANT